MTVKIFADPPAEPALLLKKVQAAELMSVSPRTFQTFKIPPVELPGGGIRFARSAILEWIEQHQSK
jgi:hypothetical protein